MVRANVLFVQLLLLLQLPLKYVPFIYDLAGHYQPCGKRLLNMIKPLNIIELN